MDDPPNGYPHEAPFARFIRNPGTANVSVQPLSDEEHQRIDLAVSDLKLKKPDHYQVIWLAYIKRLPDKRIGYVLKTSRSSVRNLRENAENWLDGKLS